MGGAKTKSLGLKKSWSVRGYTLSTPTLATVPGVEPGAVPGAHGRVDTGNVGRVDLTALGRLLRVAQEVLLRVAEEPRLLHSLLALWGGGGGGGGGELTDPSSPSCYRTHTERT